MFQVQAAPKAQWESWAASGTACKEPLEVRKRSPQTLDQWVGVRLGLSVVSFSRALLPFEFQQTHFRKACVETPAAVPGLCAETPTLSMLEPQSYRTSFVSVSSAQSLISLRTRLWRAFRQS